MFSGSLVERPMENFKIENFEKERPGDKFPEFSTLDRYHAEQLRDRFKAQFSLGSEADESDLLKAIEATERILIGTNAEKSDFRLDTVVAGCGIRPHQHVFLNWYRFDRIDKFLMKDLSRYFSYIWYPSSDDIDVFDSSISWVVSIRHDGAVSFSDSHLWRAVTRRKT